MFDVRLTGVPTIVRCEPHWQWKSNGSNDFDFWYILDGKGTLVLNGKSHALTPGCCFIIPPNSKIHATQDLKNRLLVFYLHFDFLLPDGKKADKSPNSIPEFVHVLSNQNFLGTLARKCQVAFKRKEPIGIFQAETILKQMLLVLHEEKFIRSPDPIESKVSEIIHQIESDPRRDWNVGIMAKQIHLSRSQFTRRFKQLTQVTPNRFVILSRLNRACQLLEETDFTIGEIADALGYEDIFFFSKQFKSFKGISPLEMKRQQRKHRVV